MTRNEHTAIVLSTLLVLAASGADAGPAGIVEPVEPFIGDFSEGFEGFFLGECCDLEIFFGNGLGTPLFATSFSSFMGSTVTAHSGILMAHSTAPVEFRFPLPVQQFGGYMATNGGADGGQVEFYDAHDRLIDTMPLDVTFTTGNAPYSWNGWTSCVPLSRVRVIGHGVLQAFLGFDDLQMSFPGKFEDCNANGIGDACELDLGIGFDFNANGVLDDCEPDCNGNGLPDFLDIAFNLSDDCNENEVPDECEFDSGEQLDCNANGVPDECDITSGDSSDENQNMVPDDCDIATTDLNLDGVVDVQDLALLIAAWGPCPAPEPPCLGDTNGDGTVDVVDLVALLFSWGLSA